VILPQLTLKKAILGEVLFKTCRNTYPKASSSHRSMLPAQVGSLWAEEMARSHREKGEAILAEAPAQVKHAEGPR
jgi:hypothetical protein